jgi:P pilus assembly chaperone PapD
MRLVFGAWFYLLISVLNPQAANFTLVPWILIFEPQNKIINQIVSFKYQGPEVKGLAGKMGPIPNSEKNAPVPVEITISARELTQTGAVIYPSAQGADDFVVYPSQFILYPGDIKKVQVQWVGTKIPSKEVTFGFIATQIPLEFKEPEEKPKTAIGRVDVQTRYEGVIVVRPANVKPEVIVDSAYYLKDSLGYHLVTLIENTGSGMQLLRNVEFTVTPVDNAGKLNLSGIIHYKPTKSPDAATQSLMAGFRRKLVVDWPTNLPVSKVKVTVQFPISPN